MKPAPVPVGCTVCATRDLSPRLVGYTLPTITLVDTCLSCQAQFSRTVALDIYDRGLELSGGDELVQLAPWIKT